MSARDSGTVVVGVDPGPTPGVVGLLIEDDGKGPRITDVQLAQVSAGMIGLTLGGMVMRWAKFLDVDVLVATERFVVSARSGRSSSAGAGRITRDMVGTVERCASEEIGAATVQRSASIVKPWATDERLKLAGILIPKGMTHTKDGARHALYAAVHAGFLPDPMSKQYRKPKLT